MNLFRVPVALSFLIVVGLCEWPAAASAQQAQPAKKPLDLIVPLPKNPKGAPPPVRIPPFMLKKNMSVVVVMGTGQTMQSKLRLAQTAAKGFLDKIDKNSKAGLILFTNDIYKTVKPTNKHEDVKAALGAAKLGGGNRWGEAVLKATDMLAAVKPKGPRVVLLITDYQDTGSKTTTKAIVKLAKKNGVRIWAVQLGAGPQGLPLRSALTLDCSNSMKKHLDNLRNAAFSYVNLMPMQMGDATVITFARNVLKPAPLGGQFSQDRTVIRKTIAAGAAKVKYGTRCWTAAATAIDAFVKARKPGLRVREHVVLFTDGKPVGDTDRDLSALIAKAKKEKVAVHVLLFTNVWKTKKKLKYMQRGAWPIAKRKMDKIHRLYRSTGGTLNVIEGGNQLVRKFVALANLLRPRFLPNPNLQYVASQTNGLYGPVPDPQDLPAGLEWLADRLNVRGAKKK